MCIRDRSYMTENEVERIFRDSRINIIVEGANEVMQSFIFAYGGKQLAEKMLGVQQAVGWDKDQSFGGNLGRSMKNMFRPNVARAAVPLATEIFLRKRPSAPTAPVVHPSLREAAARMVELTRDLTHEFKLASKRYGEAIVSRQSVQARLADVAIWLHAWACTLSKLNQQIERGTAQELEKTAAMHYFDLAEHES